MSVEPEFSPDLPPEEGPADAFMLRHAEQRRRRLRSRLRISVPLAVLTVPAAIVVGVVSGWPWAWIVVGELGALCLVGTINLTSDLEQQRPRPDTALEVGVVVGVEIISWGNADGSTHTARVIARPPGSTADQLVHGTRTFSAAKGCQIRPGMLLGFRRHPTMRHLVWTEPVQDPLTLFGIYDGRSWERADVLDAIVESVHIDAEPDGDWWPVTVTARHRGELITDTRLRLPEELAQFEPGRRVEVARQQNAYLSGTSVWAVLPETA